MIRSHGLLRSNIIFVLESKVILEAVQAFFLPYILRLRNLFIDSIEEQHI
jgi:hypothetical protein